MKFRKQLQSSCVMIAFCALCAPIALGQPSTLEPRTISEEPEHAVGVWVHGSTAFVADSSYTIWFYDLADPDTVRLTGSFETPGHAVDVVADDLFMYVCDVDFGLVIAYIGNLSQPVLVAVEPVATALALAVSGDVACVAAGAAGLLVYNVHAPGNPIWLDSLQTNGYAVDVVVKDSLAYVLTSETLEVISLSTTSFGHLISSTPIGLYCLALSVDGQYAYIAAAYSVHIVEVSNPSKPVRRSDVDTEYTTGVFGSGSNLYVTDYFRGLLSIDVSNPRIPRLVNQVADGLTARDVFYQDGSVYVANLENFLSFREAPGEELLRLSSVHKTPDAVLDVHVEGDRLYIANNGVGFRTYDVSRPESPVLIDSLVSGYGFSVDAEDTLLYVCSGDVQVFNVADPREPIRVGYFRSPDLYAMDLELTGPFALVANGTGFLTVLDVHLPWRPTLVTQLPLSGVPSRVVLADSIAYVASRVGGLQVVNVARPWLPIWIDSLATPDEALSLALGDGLVTMACRAAELQIVDIASPGQISLIGSAEWEGFTRDVSARGSQAFITDDLAGIMVFDLTDPSTPHRLQTTSTGSITYALGVGNGVLYAGTVFDVRAFSLDPVCITLNNGLQTLSHVVNHSPAVTWAAYDSGLVQQAFEIEVGTDTDWQVAELWDTDSVSSPAVAVAYAGEPLLDGETYYLRLRVASGVGWGRWSQREFHMNALPEAPLVLAPTAAAVLGTRQPELVAEALSDADRDRQQFEFSVYTSESVLVARSELLPNVPVSEGYKRRWTVDTPLTDFGHYLWSVKTWDGFEWSPPSELMGFSIAVPPQRPSAVGLWKPAYKQVVYASAPVFVWSPATDPNMMDSLAYRLEIADNSLFIAAATAGGLTDTVYAWSEPLVAGRTHWWQVVSYDNVGLADTSWINQFRMYVPGDANVSAAVTVTDIVVLVSYLFRDGPLQIPECAASVDGDSLLLTLDVVWLVNYVLKGGPPPMPGCP